MSSDGYDSLETLFPPTHHKPFYRAYDEYLDDEDWGNVSVSILKKPEDFFTSPKPSDIISSVEITEDQDLRNQEDWNYLAGKVVGAEDSN